MYCANCGVKAMEGAGFCQNCGSSLGFSTSAEQTETSQNTSFDFDMNNMNNMNNMDRIADSQPFIPVSQPVPEIIPDVVIEQTPGYTPEIIPNPIPAPFPETVPDTFPDPTSTAGISATGITEDEILGKEPKISADVKERNIEKFAFEQSDINENNNERTFAFPKTESVAFNNTEFNNNTPYDKKANNKKDKKANKKIKKSKAEKKYYGKPLIVFCFIFIIILSITCGVFAGLYFKAVETPNSRRQNMITNSFSDRYIR